MKRYGLLGGVVVVVLAVALMAGVIGNPVALAEGSYPGPATGSSQQRGIWVSGQGRVSVTPDIAVLRLVIEAQADTVVKAREQAAETMEAVIAALKAHDVAEEDIDTIDLSICRVWGMPPMWKLCPRTGRMMDECELAAYRVSKMVSATIRELDEVGVIVNAVAEAGGDLIRIHGVGFTVEDRTPYLYEARKEAFADAKAKAEQLARLAGVTLGKPTFISEGMVHFPLAFRECMVSFPPGPTTQYISFRPLPPAGPPRTIRHCGVVSSIAIARAGVFVTPLMPGEQEVIVNVQVVFAIE